MKGEQRIVNLTMGVLADSIVEQLTAQGLTFDAEKMEHFQMDMDAISRLGVRGILNDSQRRLAHQRLFKRIVKHVTEYGRGNR